MYESDKSHVGMSHVTVMSHVWMCHDIYNACVHCWCAPVLWMSHVKYKNESCRTHNFE